MHCFHALWKARTRPLKDTGRALYSICPLLVVAVHPFQRQWGEGSRKQKRDKNVSRSTTTFFNFTFTHWHIHTSQMVLDRTHFNFWSPCMLVHEHWTGLGENLARHDKLETKERKTHIYWKDYATCESSTSQVGTILELELAIQSWSKSWAESNPDAANIGKQTTLSNGFLARHPIALPCRRSNFTAPVASVPHRQLQNLWLSDLYFPQPPTSHHHTGLQDQIDNRENTPASYQLASLFDFQVFHPVIFNETKSGLSPMNATQTKTKTKWA